MIFSNFTWLYAHHHQFQNIFVTPTRNPYPLHSPFPLTSSPWQPLIYFLSLCICLFCIFHINGIIGYVVFCVWLPWLSMLYSMSGLYAIGILPLIFLIHICKYTLNIFNSYRLESYFLYSITFTKLLFLIWVCNLWKHF